MALKHVIGEHTQAELRRNARCARMMAFAGTFEGSNGSTAPTRMPRKRKSTRQRKLVTHRHREQFKVSAHRTYISEQSKDTDDKPDLSRLNAMWRNISPIERSTVIAPVESRRQTILAGGNVGNISLRRADRREMQIENRTHQLRLLRENVSESLLQHGNRRLETWTRTP